MNLLPAAVIAIAAVIVAAPFLAGDRESPESSGYLYALYTDPESNLDMIYVYESHFECGKATPLAQKYRVSDEEGDINPFWKFSEETGKGPFDLRRRRFCGAEDEFGRRDGRLHPGSR